MQCGACGGAVEQLDLIDGSVFGGARVPALHCASCGTWHDLEGTLICGECAHTHRPAHTHLGGRPGSIYGIFSHFTFCACQEPDPRDAELPIVVQNQRHDHGMSSDWRDHDTGVGW